MNEQENQNKLVKQAQNGNAEAISELWNIITPKLFGYLVNVTRDKQVAEDLLQQTWLKAIKNLSDFKDTGNKFSSWLFAIAKNECRQYWRKNKEQLFDDEIEITNHPLHAPKNDDSILIDQILNSLSREDQEILRLRYIADLPVNDIARILNINLVAVRVRLHRAVARTKEIIKE